MTQHIRQEDWAVTLLDKVGARTYIAADGVWIISIPRQHERPRVQLAVEDLERTAGKPCCVIWSRRLE